jgi:hypothetical protein
MFSLIKLRNSSDVVTAQHNIQYNLDNENKALTTYNQDLLNSLNIDSLTEVDQTSLQTTLKKTTDLTVYIDNIILTSFWSLNKDGMTKEDAKKTLSKNYVGLSNAAMDLNLVRGSSAENENLETLLIKVAKFENEMASIFGTPANFTYNKPNFEEYISRKNSHFPVGLVIQDLATLKLQVQKSQTILLAYYKGKVS